MIFYIKLQAVFIYIYAVFYGIAGLVGIFLAISERDYTNLWMFVLFTPIAFLLHLFAQSHFRMATRTQNYINFCKAVGINDEREHSVKFFSQFRLKLK